MTVRWLFALVWPAMVGCLAGPRPIPRAQLDVMSTRTYVAAYDEVLDATALALEELGFAVSKVDEAEGLVIAARADGAGYRALVRTRDGAQEVIASPTPERDLWVIDGVDGERERWDALEQSTRALLAAWRDVPEWKYAPEHNLISVLTFQAKPPPAWKRVEPSVSRRELVVQQLATRRGFNPTIVFSITRRRPVVESVSFLASTAGTALGAKSRLSWPEDTKGTLDAAGVHGVAEVLDGPVPRSVSWHLWDGRSSAWVVRAAAVCDVEDRCDDDWRSLTESIVAPQFRPGLKRR